MLREFLCLLEGFLVLSMEVSFKRISANISASFFQRLQVFIEPRDDASLEVELMCILL